jgi:hypothetical protein
MYTIQLSMQEHTLCAHLVQAPKLHKNPKLSTKPQPNLHKNPQVPLINITSLCQIIWAYVHMAPNSGQSEPAPTSTPSTKCMDEHQLS